MIRASCLLATFALSTAAQAQSLTGLPETATISAEQPAHSARMSLPIGPWHSETMKNLPIEGQITQTAWRIPQNSLTPLDLLAPVRAGLEAAGFAPLYECAAQECGGFDFRYALPLLPEPEMHVDLVDYQYFIAQNGPDVVALVASRTSESGFIQATQIRGAQHSAPTRAPRLPTATKPITTAAPLAQQLSQNGHAALEDLVFSSGAAALEPQDYASLQALADYLKATPQARAALVGHTDATGALAGNIALSKRRAQAVRERLVEKWDVSPDQITAEGAGWLAPRATNDTPEGREKNRRVEVVITSTPS